MKRAAGILLIVIAGGVLWLERSTAPAPAPAPSPTHEVRNIPAELETALRSLEIPARDRQIWAGLLSGIGRFVAADGTAKSPMVVTMSDLERLRNAAVAAPVEPVSGGDKIGAAIGPHIDRVGKAGDKLNEGGRRAKLVDLFLGAGSVLRGP